MILDLFSKRHKPMPDVFVYHKLPDKLRVQVVHILLGTLGDFVLDMSDGWRWLAQAIAQEHGLIDLPDVPVSRYGGADYRSGCLNYVLKAAMAEALDMIEVAFRFIEKANDNVDYLLRTQINAKAASTAIDELNHRFRENSCGFQFESGQIMRVDSQLLHGEVVQPVLAFLSMKGFEGPNAEFLAAHEHLRHGRIEPAMTEACKAFESTMKAICDARSWKYDSAKATAHTLIKILIDNGLVPRYSEEQLIFVEKSLLGVATLRNKDAGHGAGAKPRDVPPHFAAYALHLAASNIVFLVECHGAKPSP